MRYLICLFVLAGCATTERYWEKPGASSSEFDMDRAQCQAQALSTAGMYMMQMALVLNACMRGKGWYIVER
jgi:hypothetical protein